MRPAPNVPASAVSTLSPDGRDSSPVKVGDPAAEDAALVRATRAGDLTAFDRLVERHQRRAVSIAYRVLGNAHDAADVCQDAFVKAFRSLDTLEDPLRFSAWLMRIVSNLSLNFRRGRGRRALTIVTDERGDAAGADPSVAVPLAGAGPSPGERLLSAELESAISGVIDALPEKQRMSLLLFAVEGLPQKEVAEILDISVEMVKWNVFQARKTLKERLAEYLTE